MNLNELAIRVHEANARWWHDPATGEPIKRNREEMLMLVVSELSEAMEGARKDIMDDKLPHRSMEEVEMADAMIRLLDLVGGFGYTLPKEQNLVHLPNNKGAALFQLVKLTVKYEESFTGLDPVVAINHLIAGVWSYCLFFHLDLWGAFEEKMAYNATRKDHTNEARLQPGGKKW